MFMAFSVETVRDQRSQCLDSNINVWMFTTEVMLISSMVCVITFGGVSELDWLSFFGFPKLTVQ